MGGVGLDHLHPPFQQWELRMFLPLPQLNGAFLPLAGEFRASRDGGTEGRPWLPGTICKYLPLPIKLPVGWMPCV